MRETKDPRSVPEHVGVSFDGVLLDAQLLAAEFKLLKEDTLLLPSCLWRFAVVSELHHLWHAGVYHTPAPAPASAPAPAQPARRARDRCDCTAGAGVGRVTRCGEQQQRHKHEWRIHALMVRGRRGKYTAKKVVRLNASANETGRPRI